MSRQIQVSPHPKKPGVIATCECGWTDYWAADDGSAEQSAALHKCSPWLQGIPLPVGASAPRPATTQEQPRNHVPDDHEYDSCTCHTTSFPPCGWCEEDAEQDDE